jgi:hypothetical protein
LKCEFSGQVLEGIQILNFMKIRLVEANLGCRDGLTDRHEEDNSLYRLHREEWKEPEEKEKNIE